MQNKYIKSLRLRAIQLDRLFLLKDDIFLRMVDCLIKENNSSNTKRICKSLLEVNKLKDARVYKATSAFRDSLIQYLGYCYIYEVCEEKPLVGKRVKSIDEINDGSNHLIYIRMIYQL